MTKIIFFIGPTVFMIGLLLLSFSGLATAQTSKITIGTEPGVVDEAVTDARLTVDYSLRFFKETFNLELQKDIRILIVPNPETYAAVLMREGKVNSKEADRRARTTIGWSIGDDLILQNTGAPFNPNTRRRIYNMSHEIVHKFQGQECMNQCSRIMWFYEGAAGAFAARVVEMSGNRTLAQQKMSWMDEVRKLTRRPELREMVSQSDWNRGVEKYGTDPFYSLAALAVSALIEEKGYGSVFAYFKTLKDVGHEESFKKAFGMDLKRFESEFNASLENLPNRGRPSS